MAAVNPDQTGDVAYYVASALLALFYIGVACLFSAIALSVAMRLREFHRDGMARLRRAKR